MFPTRSSSSTVAWTAILLLTQPPGSTAAAATPDLIESAVQSQAQPRDPRSDVPRPASAREQELLTATAEDPGKLAAWLELVKLQETRGALVEAEGTFRDALRGTGASAQVLMEMARFFSRTGQFDKAVVALEDAAAQNPSDPSGHQLVATQYLEKAQKDTSLTPAEKLTYLDAGIAATDRALALNPDFVEALTYKGMLLRLKGTLDADPTSRAALISEADALRIRATAASKGRPGAIAATSGPAPPPPPGFTDVDGQAPMRVGGNIKAPTKTQHVAPVYPPDAEAARVAGVVILEVVVDTLGQVRDARVLRSIPMLDQAALDAVRAWRFTPTLLNGAPVPVIMTVTVNFTLQEERALAFRR